MIKLRKNKKGGINFSMVDGLYLFNGKCCVDSDIDNSNFTGIRAICCRNNKIMTILRVIKFLFKN